MIRAVTIMSAAILLNAVAFGAQAQSEEPSAEPSAPNYDRPKQDRADDFTDGTIERFAEAYSSIAKIQRELSDNLQEVDGRDQAMELQREAQNEMIETVESHDLTIKKYNDVVAAMQADVVLRNRILDLIGG